MPGHLPGRKTGNSFLLVVVYGLKTRDYSYLDIFHPSRRLSQAAADRSIPLRFLFPQDVEDFLSGDRGARTPPETVFLFRGEVSPDLIRFIEKKGFRTINSAPAVQLAGDKLATARFLEENGFPTPRIYTGGINKSGETFPFPAVLKPRFGSRGCGVTLIRSPDEIPQGDFVVQEYVKTSHGRDLRVFFAGGSVLAAAERRSTGGMLISNACTGGTVFPSPFTPAVPEPLRTMTLSIAEKSGLWYGSIDYLYASEKPDPEHLTVCELNAFPGFTALEKEGGFDIAGALMDALKPLLFSDQLF